MLMPKYALTTHLCNPFEVAKNIGKPRAVRAAAFSSLVALWTTVGLVADLRDLLDTFGALLSLAEMRVTLVVDLLAVGVRLAAAFFDFLLATMIDAPNLNSLLECRLSRLL